MSWQDIVIDILKMLGVTTLEELTPEQARDFAQRKILSDRALVEHWRNAIDYGDDSLIEEITSNMTQWLDNELDIYDSTRRNVRNRITEVW